MPSSIPPREDHPPPDGARLVEIGRIARPHGLRGELRVSLYWPASRTLFDVEQVVLIGADGAQATRRVVRARPAHGAVLVTFAGIDDRQAAGALRGARVAVPRAALPEPEPGEYYLVDLVGARVLAPDAAGALVAVGEVTSVRQLPSVDVLVVKTADGSLREQPLASASIRQVDAAAGRVVLHDTEGWV